MALALENAKPPLRRGMSSAPANGLTELQLSRRNQRVSAPLRSMRGPRDRIQGEVEIATFSSRTVRN